jgi:hypothetical protein
VANVLIHHDIDESGKSFFLNRGYKGRYFFPHRLLYVRRCGPDGFQTARQLLKLHKPCKLWEVILYAIGPVVDEFPDDLFFDDDVMWHQRQLGLRGQIASANLAVEGARLYTFNHLSDLVQRISRRREYKTRVENRFKGWHFMLLNGILNFAVKRDLREVYIPTADLVMQSVDPARRETVQPELFARLYDRDVNALFATRQEGLWWVVDVAANRDRLVVPEKKRLHLASMRKTICLFHDLERGLGHEGIDAELAEYANQHGDRLLQQMLATEAQMQLQTTYNVVGTIWDEVKHQIREGNHCLAFHSYDHSIEPPKPDLTAPIGLLGGLPSPLRVFLRSAKHQLWNRGRGNYPSQLDQCRTLDYRIKGYRPPQSVVTPELTDENLIIPLKQSCPICRIGLSKSLSFMMTILCISATCRTKPGRRASSSSSVSMILSPLAYMIVMLIIGCHTING